MSQNRKVIPKKLQDKILIKSANTCCVCKNIEKGCQIHHIDENATNSYQEDNLIALCLGCHNEAHTKHQFSQNLTPERLLKFKTEWEKEVNYISSSSIYRHKVLQQKEENEEKLSLEEKYIQEAREKFKKLDNTIKFNLDISKKAKIDEEMILLFTEYKNIVSRVYNPKQLKNYIDKIEDISCSSKEKLKKEILEIYIKNVTDTQDKERVYRRNDVDSLLESYPELVSYVNLYRENYTYKPQTLSDFFDSFIFKGKTFLNKKEEFILCKYKDEIKQEMISSSDFLQKTVSVVLNHSRDSDINCLCEIFKELANENEEYKNKIDVFCIGVTK